MRNSIVAIDENNVEKFLCSTILDLHRSGC